MCSNLPLAHIDAMCFHLPIPCSGEFSPSSVVLMSTAASSVNEENSAGTMVLKSKEQLQRLRDKWADSTPSARLKRSNKKTHKTIKPSHLNSPVSFERQPLTGGKRKREGEETFSWTKCVLISLILWNNKTFVLMKAHLGIFWFENQKRITSKTRIDFIGWYKKHHNWKKKKGKKRKQNLKPGESTVFWCVTQSIK